MAIITKVANFDEEWESWIECKCTQCDYKFKQDTDDLELDDEEPVVQCPNCNYEAPLTLIGPID